MLESLGFRLHDSHPDYGRCTWMGPHEVTFDLESAAVPQLPQLMAEIIDIAKKSGKHAAQKAMQNALGL
ncbi:hypothetical protein [Verrucomicrobium sp. BvORR034]|uniref:hypothetical protein n=1 Tax=Verrucomicrobium sp. BvORR034 TaxID=1396418 RepID=UPI0006794CB8|nr:hypothetical protein [Verrucomicrobium sp. BvORR034]